MPIPVKTSQGTVTIAYGYDSLPLGFSLSLKKFTRGMNPGGMGDASFASTVRLRDEAKRIDRSREISMNEPLVHGKYTFYQSGILPSEKGSVLTVAYDPGFALKYLGSVMTCLGTLIMFVTRSRLAKVLPFISSTNATKTKEQIMRRAIAAASVALVFLTGSAFGAADTPTRSASEGVSGPTVGDIPSFASRACIAAQQFDWAAWRSLPVQDGGRQKPLDSLAWETWRLLGNRVSFTDPETNRTLDATAFYVASMLESSTWDKKPANLPSPSGRGAGGEGPDRSASPHPNPLPKGAGTCSGCQPAKGDKWDALPLLLVDSIDLRKLLAMPAGQRCISADELRHARITPPGAAKPTTFMFWSQQLVFRPEEELSPLEKQGRGNVQPAAGLRGPPCRPAAGNPAHGWVRAEAVVLARNADADATR